MKKLLALVFLILIINVIKAQVSKTINVSTTGTLSALLTEAEKTTITDLTIIGNIDARDFKCMRDKMSALSVLDISMATILKYEGVEGTYTFQQMSYPENEIPTFAFTVGPPPCEFDYCISKLSSIKLPLTLNSIGTYAFGYCKQLTKLTLPSSLMTINRYAFYNCINLANINTLNPIPPIVNDNAFNNVSATVHVTTNSALLEYKANTSWSRFTIILDNTLTARTIEINAESNRIHAYPNPVKDQLKIDLIGGSTFEILNLMGQIVYTGNLNNSNIVQTSNFSSGVYLIKFNAGKSLEYKKIIKK
jgi:hypothetical protein